MASEASLSVGGEVGGGRGRRECAYYSMKLQYISRIRFPLVVLCIMYLPLHSKDHSSSSLAYLTPRFPFLSVLLMLSLAKEIL